MIFCPKVWTGLLAALGVLGFFVLVSNAGPRLEIPRVDMAGAEEEALDDGDISDAVEIELLLDEGVSSHLIDVAVDNHEVVLSGTVGSAIEKTRAFNTAWVSGVDGVDISGLEVEVWARDEDERQMAVMKSDEEIRSAVNDAFLYDPRVFSFEIDVDVNNGLVTLEGEVDNLKAKRAGAQDARNTPGVWNVDNHILVRPMDVPTDEEIEQNLKDALLWNPIVERFDITVAVRNKKVHLYGRVDDLYEKMTAEDVASRINGVASVENNIDVDEVWTWKSDRQIRQDIESQLAWNIIVDEEEIEVSVDNGAATLEGEVDTLMELDAAIKEAFDGGARRVINRLSIDESPDYYPGIFYQDFRWPYWPHWPYYPPLWS